LFYVALNRLAGVKGGNFWGWRQSFGRLRRERV